MGTKSAAVGNTKEPGGRQPAPAPLDLVPRFVNTYDRLTRRGIIETPEALDRWIAARGLNRGTPVTRNDLRYVHDVRELLRSVLKAHNGAPLDSPLIERLNESSARAPLVLRLQTDGRPCVVSDAAGARGVVAAVLASAIQAADRDIWGRLKACRECDWVFYDRSKNRSGTWCTMTICGSRSKMRAYRKRRGVKVG